MLSRSIAAPVGLKKVSRCSAARSALLRLAVPPFAGLASVAYGCCAGAAPPAGGVENSVKRSTSPRVDAALVGPRGVDEAHGHRHAGGRDVELEVVGHRDRVEEGPVVRRVGEFLDRGVVDRQAGSGCR